MILFVKKLVLLFMLVLLPFQFSWAAVAVYCQHEQAPAAQEHFGHHKHEHQGQPDTPEPEPIKKVDNDCSYCHLAAQAPLLIDAADVIPSANSVYNASPIESFSSHIPESPRRPDRRLVA